MENRTMRYSILIPFLLILICCKENSSELTLTDVRPPAQSFAIRNDRDTLIEGNKGTRIKFLKNSFTTTDGQEIKGDVHIQLAEFYTTEDFISNRLSTNTTDGNILKSSGMVFIEATSNGKALKLSDTKPMTIMFKRIQLSNTANLFLGEKGPQNEIRWRALAPVHNDTIVLIEKTVTQLSYGEEKVEVEVRILIGKDTMKLTEANKGQFEKVLARYRTFDLSEDTLDNTQTNSLITNKSYDPDRLYIFETTNLGYLNCDIFIEREFYTSIVVKSNHNNTDMFIVLDTMKSVIYPDSRSNEKVSIGHFTIPKGQAITIVGYNKSGQNHSYSIKRLPGHMDTVTLDLKQESLPNIRDVIRKLE